MAALALPSALSIPPITPFRIMNTPIRNMGVPYSTHRSIVSPAPRRSSRGLWKISRSIDIGIETATESTTAWEAILSAVLFSPLPMALPIADAAPTPTPLPMPTSMKKRGNTKPTAARASGPSPATHTESMRLLAVWAIMAIMKGTDSATIAFFGSPRSVSTPLVLFSSIDVML